MVAKKTSSYRTGDRSEALTSADEILNLAKELLSTDDFDRAIKLSTMLVSSKTVKRTAIEELVELAAPPPNVLCHMLSMKSSSFPDGPETRSGIWETTSML